MYTYIYVYACICVYISIHMCCVCACLLLSGARASMGRRLHEIVVVRVAVDEAARLRNAMRCGEFQSEYSDYSDLLRLTQTYSDLLRLTQATHPQVDEPVGVQNKRGLHSTTGGSADSPFGADGSERVHRRVHLAPHSTAGPCVHQLAPRLSPMCQPVQTAQEGGHRLWRPQPTVAFCAQAGSAHARAAERAARPNARAGACTCVGHPASVRARACELGVPRSICCR
jgi:hypothetical protein